MCGISGIWHLDRETLQQQKLERFTDSMQHRGPDGRGFFIDQKAQLGLGHRRLSILDLSNAAAQPMHSSDNDLVICYNGEIFNFIELKKELEQSGFSFQTTSDTEVILAAYKKWDKDCLNKFNGMWAFAIWNKAEKKLFLARDRFGIKPLYYTHSPNNFFAFASETYAFKFLDGYTRRAAADKLARTLHNPSWPEGSGYTIFENILQVLPGHFMEVSEKNIPTQKRWWDTKKNLQQVPGSYSQQVEQFRDLFESACRLRMRSDVTLASALSGGVDSSSVYCMLHNLMQKQSAERAPANWQQAYVATFPGTSVDEEKYAREVIDYIHGKGVFIKQEYPQLDQRILETTRLFDSITATPIIAVSDIYRSMRENGIKVSMDGHGVDEMLFGYTGSVSSVYIQELLENKTNASAMLELFADLHLPEMQDSVRSQLIAKGQQKIKQISPKISLLRSTLKKFAKGIIQRSPSLPATATDAWLNNMVAPELMQLTASPYSLEEFSYADLLLFEEFHLTTLPLNFRDFDRASMMNSIEIRMPFMDYRLVSFVFSLPMSSKIGQGYTKRILRDAMKGLMPETIRTRKLKIGLAAPTADWFKGPIKTLLLDTARSQNFLKSPYWNGKLLSSYIEEHSKNGSWEKNNSARVWSFINAHLILN